MDKYYKIKQSTLTSFADQARRINGSTGSLTTEQMLNIFEGAGQGQGESENNSYADQLYEFYGVDKNTYPYLCIALQHNGYTTISFSMTIRQVSETVLMIVSYQKSNGHDSESPISDLENIEEVVNKTMVNFPTLTNSSYADSFNTIGGTSEYVYTNFDIEHKSSSIYYGRLDQDKEEIIINLQDKTFTENGTFTADEGYDGFSQVTVNVEADLTEIAELIGGDA